MGDDETLGFSDGDDLGIMDDGDLGIMDSDGGDLGIMDSDGGDLGIMDDGDLGIMDSDGDGLGVMDSDGGDLGVLDDNDATPDPSAVPLVRVVEGRGGSTMRLFNATELAKQTERLEGLKGDDEKAMRRANREERRTIKERFSPRRPISYNGSAADPEQPSPGVPVTAAFPPEEQKRASFSLSESDPGASPTSGAAAPERNKFDLSPSGSEAGSVHAVADPAPATTTVDAARPAPRQVAAISAEVREAAGRRTSSSLYVLSSDDDDDAGAANLQAALTTASGQAAAGGGAQNAIPGTEPAAAGSDLLQVYEPGYWAEASYAWEAKGEHELTFQRGDKLWITNDSDEWWTAWNVDGERGLVPYNRIADGEVSPPPGFTGGSPLHETPVKVKTAKPKSKIAELQAKLARQGFQAGGMAAGGSKGLVKAGDAGAVRSDSASGAETSATAGSAAAMTSPDGPLEALTASRPKAPGTRRPPTRRHRRSNK